MIDGGWETWAWLALAGVAGWRIAKRSVAESAGEKTHWWNWAFAALVFLFGAAAFLYIATSPQERCDESSEAILFILYPVAIVGAVAAIVLQRRGRGES